jgi:hypothetical protein
MPRHTEPLSDAIIRNAKPKDGPYKLFDGGGLFLLIVPAGGKLWRLKYRFRSVAAGTTCGRENPYGND